MLAHRPVISSLNDGFVETPMGLAFGYLANINADTTPKWLSESLQRKPPGSLLPTSPKRGGERNSGWIADPAMRCLRIAEDTASQETAATEG